MPSLNSLRLRAAGVRVPNTARWISSELKRLARLTIMLLPSSFHSRIEPGPIPSFRRTSAGTEICPCAVTFDCAIGIFLYYQGNGGLALSDRFRINGPPHRRSCESIFEIDGLTDESVCPTLVRKGLRCCTTPFEFFAGRDDSS